MPYTTPTLADATTALASRLNDPTNVYWSLPELSGYVNEALRTWSVWTQNWRDTGTFTTTINEPFYALALELPTLLGQTVTNWDLVAAVQYALLEPAAPGGTWTGTDQFTLSQITAAIQRRRDQFLHETGMIQTRSQLSVASPPASGRIPLPETVLSIRRAAWRDSISQVLYPLLVTDEWAANNFRRSWPVSIAPPQYYSVTDTPPITLQIIPPPLNDGTLDYVAIQQGPIVSSGSNASLAVPDDYLWVLKYGVLADLLSGDGLALDPARAGYCELRWQQGIEVARRNPVVLSGRINGLPVTLSSLSEADRYSPLWQLVSGTPQQILLTGQNLVALWPPPGATDGPWTIQLDLVTNAPVPVVPADVLQVSPDVYDSLLDLAQHAALFKQGDGQVELAMALLDRAARAAGITSRFQQASQPSRVPMFGQTAQDRRAVAEQRDVPVSAAVVES